MERNVGEKQLELSAVQGASKSIIGCKILCVL